MMANRDWIYVNNTFLVNTKNTYRKANKLFTDTYAKLTNESADPDIAVMVAEYEPVYQSFVTNYTNWGTIKGTYHGKTASLEELLVTNMPLQIRRWEGAVRAIFTEDSPTEKEIFPNKRTPFLSGYYDDRISAVKSLADKLLEYPALAATQLLVESYYNQLESTRLLQQQKEGSVAGMSILIENQRIIVCHVLYGILGLLMHKYKTDPNDLIRFFDLELLRSTSNDDDEEEEEEEEEETPPSPTE